MTTMALETNNKRLVLIICFLSVAFNCTPATCMPRSSLPLNRSASPYSAPQGLPDSSPMPQPVSSMNPSPPIYSPPNGQPIASPSLNPDSSLPPKSASSPDKAPPVIDNMGPSSPIDTPPQRQPSQNPVPKSASSSLNGGRPMPSSQSQPSKFASPTKKPDLEAICATTEHPALCLSFISPFLGVIGEVDPISVLEIAIKVCAKHAKMAVAVASKFSTLLHIDSTTVSSLDRCTDSFKDALDNLQTTLDAISTKDIGTMNSMLSAAVTDFADCADAFIGLVSPLAAYTDKLLKMAGICLAIVALI